MTADTLLKALERDIDSFAAVEHSRWSHWQSYLHTQCVRQADGTLLIPADLVKRWELQTSTDYANLSDKEKESDREQVRRYFPLLAALAESI